MTQAASRISYRGAAIFAGAAAVAGMLAMLLWLPYRPEVQLGSWLWSVAKAGIAAGISAGLSFALLNLMGWRLRRGRQLARAALLGTTTVIGAHLLVGPVSALLMLIEAAVLSELRFEFHTIMVTSFLVSLFSVFFILVTIPLGIVTALIVAAREERPRTTPEAASEAIE